MRWRRMDDQSVRLRMASMPPVCLVRVGSALDDVSRALPAGLRIDDARAVLNRLRGPFLSFMVMAAPARHRPRCRTR